METNVIHTGHVLDVLREKIPDESIDCCVTSPPYYGLRAYGTEPQIWDGNADCEHEWGEDIPEFHKGQVEQIKWKNAKGAGFGQTAKMGNFCIHCGAWCGELGLEPHPSDFIRHLVQIFREIKRALKKSGSLWIVLGDTYWGSGAGTQYEPKGDCKESYIMPYISKKSQQRVKKSNWLQPKQSLLIPHRVAIAMQEDGWCLRNTVIWHKPNAMPASIKDRLNNVHEYMFHFVKSRRYYYDLDSIRVESQHISGGKFGALALRQNEKIEQREHPLGKNPGDLWSINTQPCPEAHYAVFPEELVVKPIKASCPLRGVVLDPFCGIGTTLKVAHKLGRKYIGVDLNTAIAERIMSQEIPF